MKHFARFLLISHLNNFDDSYKWDNFFHPFKSLAESESASVRLREQEERVTDRENILRSQLEQFRNEVENDRENAKKEKMIILEKFAKKGKNNFQIFQK